MVRQSTGDFQEVKLPHIILQEWTPVIIHLSRLIDCTARGVDPEGNHGLGEIMTSQRRCDWDERTTLVPDDHSRSRCVWWGKVGGYMGTLYLQLSFSVNIKLL